MIDAKDVVVRARSQIGEKTIYALGCGGYDPTAEHPYDSKRRCDCSGFSSWGIKVSRKTDHPWYRMFNGGWFETSAMFRDAQVPFGSFTEVAGPAQPGMLYVWPDRRIPGTKKKQQGHVGIIVAVDALGKPTRVVHCSKGNYEKYGDAIQETGPELFVQHRALIVRCSEVRLAA